MPSYDNARDFRQRVRFERRSEGVDDGYGNLQYEWETVAGPCAARVRPTTGNEDVSADRAQGIQTFEITVRWDSQTEQITTADRCVHERSQAIYNIRGAVNEDERSRFLTFLADQGVAT